MNALAIAWEEGVEARLNPSPYGGAAYDTRVDFWRGYLDADEWAAGELEEFPTNPYLDSDDE